MKVLLVIVAVACLLAPIFAQENVSQQEGKAPFMLKDQKTSLKKTRIENGTEAKFSKLTNKEFPSGPIR